MPKIDLVMKYRYNYIIPYQDVDASRRLRLYTMENYLLNVAGRVADEMGFGIPYELHVDHYPHEYGNDVSTSSW